MKTTYNLVRENWIPAFFISGEFRKISLYELFDKADEIASLEPNIIEQKVGLYRLAFAIAGRALAKNGKTMNSLLRRGQVNDIKRMACEYLVEQEDCFDLLSPTSPFMQVAGMVVKPKADEDKGGKGAQRGVKNLAAFSHHYASGSNVTHYSKMSDKNPLTLSFDEAALLLLEAQLSQVGQTTSDMWVPGMKDGAFITGRGGGAKGTLYRGSLAWISSGKNVLYDLCFNVVDNDTSKPTWELPDNLAKMSMDIKGQAVEDANITGSSACAIYTIMGCVMCFIHDGEKVTGALMTHGNRYFGGGKLPQKSRDPMWIMRKSNDTKKQEFFPMRFDSSSSWTSLSAFLASNLEYADECLPHCLKNREVVAESIWGDNESSYTLSLNILTLGGWKDTNFSKPQTWHYSNFPMRFMLHYSMNTQGDSETLVQDASEYIGAVAAVAQTYEEILKADLRKIISVAFPYMNSLKLKESRQAKYVSMYWDYLYVEFHNILLDFASGELPDQDISDKWKKCVQKAMMQAREAFIDSLPHSWQSIKAVFQSIPRRRTTNMKYHPKITNTIAAVRSKQQSMAFSVEDRGHLASIAKTARPSCTWANAHVYCASLSEALSPIVTKRDAEQVYLIQKVAGLMASHGAGPRSSEVSFGKNLKQLQMKSPAYKIEEKVCRAFTMPVADALRAFSTMLEMMKKQNIAIHWESFAQMLLDWNNQTYGEKYVVLSDFLFQENQKAQQPSSDVQSEVG